MTEESHHEDGRGAPEAANGDVVAHDCGGGGDEAADAAALPEYACAYCGVHHANSVVKCNTCSRWFCNVKNATGGSHIVTHLVRARHNVVLLHADSDLGDTTLECYNCGNRNVFILGFVSAKQELIVVVLCRLPCAQLKDVNWDTSNWQPLIEERQFLPWVASTEAGELAGRAVTLAQITRLEALWRQGGDAAPEPAALDDSAPEVLPILMRYNDAYQYQRAFGPLVKLESDYDRDLKELQLLEQIEVSWETGANNRVLASFALAAYESQGLKVAVGDKMVLRHQMVYSDPWESAGTIVRLPNKLEEKFVLELEPQLLHAKQRGRGVRKLPLAVSELDHSPPRVVPPPTHLTQNFTAEFVWKGTLYDRMQDALRTFALDQESVSGYIYHKILGHEVAPVEFDVKLPKKLGHPKLGELNRSQLNAVRMVLQRPLSLIQGPPGTGKTVTLAVIVYHLTRLIKETKGSKEKVLVCAPSNVAVDHLAAKLDLIGLKVLRLTAKLREDVELSVSHLALHNVIARVGLAKLKRVLKLKRELGVLKELDYAVLLKQTKIAEAKAIQDCDVICCTCVGAGDKRLRGLSFRSVLIDESTQALEPEVLIPIVNGAKQVILVGDHQQLGPVILEKRAGDAGLKQSLFERFVVLGHVPIRLEVQYRMNPCLSEFPSNMFYEGSLQNGVTNEQRLIGTMKFPWPVYQLPMMFWGNYGREEISALGNSYLNRVEAMNVEKIITKLFRDGVEPDQIGIITPYEGQRAYIVQYMSLNSTLADKRQQYLEVEVTSVDAFQGREKDFIILSCVRANDLQTIGFLSDPRRLNVAITRAKYGLIILGNPKALSRNALWNHLLVHFREKGCLVDGPLDNLQLLMVQLNTIRARAPPHQEQQTPSQQRQTMGNRKMSFDAQSIVSFAADAHSQPRAMDPSAWPSLGAELNTYGDANHINSNFAQLLNKLNVEYENRSNINIEDQLLNITGAFTSGLKLD